MTGPRSLPLRLCVFCRREVTSSVATVDFCQGCYLSGAHHRRALGQLLDELAQASGLPADVWHTGGGCWAISVPLVDGPEPARYLLVCLDQEASLPEQDEATARWWVGSYDCRADWSDPECTIEAEDIPRPDLPARVADIAALLTG